MPSVTAEEAPQAAALHEARRAARQLRRPAHRVRRQGGGDRVRGPCRRAQHAAADGLGAGRRCWRRMLDSVNMVNAPVLARERNIEVTEIKHDRAGDYQTLMRLTVTTDNRTRDVCRHPVRRRQAAPRRDQGHPHRGRARPPHALRHQRGQAGLHRPPRHRCSARPASTSPPSISAAAPPAPTPSPSSRSTRRFPTRCSPRSARSPASCRPRRWRSDRLAQIFLMRSVRNYRS